MKKIITIESGDRFSTAGIQEVAAKHSADLQGSVWEAFRAAEAKDYKKANELCRRILDREAHPEIRMLLGTCYFMQGEMVSARAVFSELVNDHPEEEQCLIYLGLTDHALENYENAVKELGKLYPLKEYQPFYYTSYGDSLRAIGRHKQAREVFYQEVLRYKTAGVILSPVMLDGAFQNLLYLDVALGNGKYPEDLKTYYDFLEQVEMTEQMQDCLAGNIAYFCSLMSNKWYRPLFLELITYVREKGYLTGEKFLETLESAFVSWESYQYHEDRQISSIMEDYLAACYERKYHFAEGLPEQEKDFIIVRALSYEWYMCQYLPEHPEEAEYVKRTYPYAYACCETFFGRVRTDAAGTAEQLLDELLPYVKGKSRQKLKESMYLVYQKARDVEKEPTFVYDGEDPYRRMQPKVGRNDPCPCGSGKKYKKCCGR